MIIDDVLIFDGQLPDPTTLLIAGVQSKPPLEGFLNQRHSQNVTLTGTMLKATGFMSGV